MKTHLLNQVIFDFVMLIKIKFVQLILPDIIYITWMVLSMERRVGDGVGAVLSEEINQLWEGKRRTGQTTHGLARITVRL